MNSGVRKIVNIVACLALVVLVPQLVYGDTDSSRLPVEGVDAGPSIALRWQATHEEGVYGYNIYRAERRQGPFMRVNAEIVRAKGAEEVSSYKFSDLGVAQGRTFYYYLDTVSVTGHKQRFSGVIKKTVAADDSSLDR